MKLPRDMERLRAQLLRDSGFQDLEGRDPDGPLSDRGNLHAVTEASGDHERLALRLADGADYVRWAESVLHDGPRFRTAQQREVWRLHSEGRSEREIGTMLTMHRRSVRRLLAETRERVSKVGKVKRWQNQNKQRKAHLRRLVRQADQAMLATLAALMLRQGRSSPSRS